MSHRNRGSKAISVSVDRDEEVNDDILLTNPPALQKLFGDSAIAKVLDFLTLYRGSDYSLTEIAENSGIGWKTLHRIWPSLERYGLVKMRRQIGRAKMFTLNVDSDISKSLMRLAFEISKNDVHKSLDMQRKE